MMKLTPVSLAAAMIFAVLCCYFLGMLPTVLIACSSLPVFVICSIIFRKPYVTILFLAGGFIIGAISYSYWSARHPLLDHIGKEHTFSGMIISNPRQSMTSDNYKYTLRINKIDDTDTKDTVLLTTPVSLQCGDKVKLTASPKAIPQQMNENGFNTALYYKSQNIYTRVYAEDIEFTGKGFAMSPYFLSQYLYSKIDRLIYRYYQGDTAALISAVITGNTHNFSKEYFSVLNNTALKRQLHPAYLHIWIILTLIDLLRRVVHKRFRSIAAVIILGIYAVFSCTNAGFTRCVAIAALMIFYRAKDGSAYYPDALAKIFIFCILTMPMIIFNVTFILSAVGGLSVSLFAPLVMERLTFIPVRFRRFCAVMIICAFVITPLGTIYFDSVCIYGFITPFIMMPLVLILLIMSPFVFLILSVWGAAPLIDFCYGLVLKMILKLPWIVDKLPLAHLPLPKPTPAAYCLIICYVFFAYYHMKKRKKAASVCAVAAFGLMLSIALSMLWHIGTTDFIFVNVGQGDGAIIHTAYGATVIIDGGGGNSYSDYDPGESIFVPYLRSKGYYNIDAAFVSHFHKDHVQGIIAAINSLKVRNVFFMPPDEDEDAIEWYNALIAAAIENGTMLCPLAENKRIDFDCGLALDVYLPDKYLILSGDENDSSLLIKAKYGSVSALYTGDMSEYAEKSYISCQTDVSSDILKVAHHGSKTAASDEWIKAVSPDYAVISCGENNTYGHPAPQTLDTLKGVKVLRTDTDGDIRVTADKNGIKRVHKFKE